MFVKAFRHVRIAMPMVFLLFAFDCARGDIRLASPAEGSTVSQLWPEQAKLVRESRVEREKYFDGAANARSIKAHKGKTMPVKFSWKGGTPPYRFALRRLPDGKVFHEAAIDTPQIEVDSLEVAREWEWTVSDADGSAKGTFRTEDGVPRLINIDGVPNARDVGGWIGLNGRRIRQGLLFRTAGLRLTVNLGPVERTVGNLRLAPYGHVLESATGESL